jgi:hypothetical protein
MDKRTNGWVLGDPAGVIPRGSSGRVWCAMSRTRLVTCDAEGLSIVPAR